MKTNFRLWAIEDSLVKPHYGLMDHSTGKQIEITSLEGGEGAAAPSGLVRGVISSAFIDILNLASSLASFIDSLCFSLILCLRTDELCKQQIKMVIRREH